MVLLLFFIKYKLVLIFSSHRNSTTAVDNKKTNESRSSEDAAEAAQFHRLPHDKVTIALVDTKEKYFNMLHHLSELNMVAIDAEWKPISRGATTDVALIQIATREQIYLIDVVLLNIVTNDWNQLVDHVFNNQQIVKIGEILYSKFAVPSNCLYPSHFFRL